MRGTSDVCDSIIAIIQEFSVARAIDVAKTSCLAGSADCWRDPAPRAASVDRNVACAMSSSRCTHGQDRPAESESDNVALERLPTCSDALDLVTWHVRTKYGRADSSYSRTWVYERVTGCDQCARCTSYGISDTLFRSSKTDAQVIEELHEAFS